VTLSSTEPKYIVISEDVKELKFIYYLLCDLHIKVNIPIVVKTDNIGAIYKSEMLQLAFVLGTWMQVTTLSKNSSKMVLLRSSIFTKIVNQELFVKYTKKFLEDSEVQGTG
jgi:hypothetical protein